MTRHNKYDNRKAKSFAAASAIVSVMTQETTLSNDKKVWKKGINFRSANGNWKGGWHFDGRGYIKVLNPGHRRANHDGYTLKHVDIFEDYHKCCMLSWGVVHHINEKRSDNRIENLQGMTKSKHTSMHAKKRQELRRQIIAP